MKLNLEGELVTIMNHRVIKRAIRTFSGVHLSQSSCPQSHQTRWAAFGRRMGELPPFLSGAIKTGKEDEKSKQETHAGYITCYKFDRQLNGNEIPPHK